MFETSHAYHINSVSFSRDFIIEYWKTAVVQLLPSKNVILCWIQAIFDTY